MGRLTNIKPDFSIPLDIVYEDGDIIIVNKQAGISVHPSANEPEGTLANVLIARHPEIKNVGDSSTNSGQAIQLRPGIVHRLDKGTSGILVVAKNQKSFEFLKKEWQEGAVTKKYLALIWGCPRKENGKIISELARSSADFRKRTVVRPGKNEGTRGKIAITEYKVIKKFKDCSLVEVSPKTGRMHQIRVHMASIGHPVVGDKVYGKRRETPAGLDRQFLHAYFLSFSLFGRRLAFEIGLPADLERVLAKIDK